MSEHEAVFLRNLVSEVKQECRNTAPRSKSTVETVYKLARVVDHLIDSMTKSDAAIRDELAKVGDPRYSSM